MQKPGDNAKPYRTPNGEINCKDHGIFRNDIFSNVFKSYNQCLSEGLFKMFRIIPGKYGYRLKHNWSQKKILYIPEYF